MVGKEIRMEVEKYGRGRLGGKGEGYDGRRNIGNYRWDREMK